MRWSSGIRAGAAQAALVATALLLLLAAAPSAEDKRLAVFAPGVSYSVPILDRDKREYVDAFELMRQLGAITTVHDHAKWSISLSGVTGEFEDGKDRARIRGTRISLGANFLGSDAPLLPLRSVSPVLAAYLGTHIDFHESARRLFVGDAGTHFTIELRRAADRSTLAIKFSAPVNPAISTEPGALRMLFTRDPVLAGTEHTSFEDKLIQGTTFSEAGGLSQLTVHGRAPLMALFTDEGRTILISAAPGPASPAETAAPAQAAQEPAAPPSQQGAVEGAEATQPRRPRFLVVLDPAHGGDETGVAFSPKLLEKDLALSLARRVRTELANRGVSAILLRDGDIAIPSDQRAAAANADRASVYVALHAGAPGTRVRVYTAMLPESSARNGAFLPWQSAQSAYLNASRSVAVAITGELEKHKIKAAQLPGPVRPLNSIAAPAVAVEISPPEGEPESMADAKYQQSVASAVAAAVAGLRPPGETGR